MGLEAHLARIIHALNHLVQPASEAEREAVAASAAGRRGSNSGSRSRSRGRVSGGLEDDTGLSPTRVSAAAGAVVTPVGSSFLVDPRARVRLQALALLEALAVKDAKRLYPHWPLFFAICDQGVGGVGEAGRFSGEVHGWVIVFQAAMGCCCFFPNHKLMLVFRWGMACFWCLKKKIKNSERILR